MNVMNSLKEKFPHISFGFHHIITEREDWDSLHEYDKFFDDVYPSSELNSFTRLILEDDQISALDVANLITSKINCTHLKLQKLLFFFYTNYIDKHRKKPFKEKFLAWDYGPVVEEVYQKYKSYGRSSMTDREDDKTPIMKGESFKLSVYSRWKKTPIYGRILDSLEETLKEFGDYTANELVELTHQKGSPWDLVFQDGIGRNDIIEID